MSFGCQLRLLLLRLWWETKSETFFGLIQFDAFVHRHSKQQALGADDVDICVKASMVAYHADGSRSVLANRALVNASI
jgi:hypothetical protein